MLSTLLPSNASTVSAKTIPAVVTTPPVPPNASTIPRGNEIAQLTTRELAVLTLIGKGLSNSEKHGGRIFGKFDLRDRAAAIVYARDNGIVAPR